MQRSIEGMARAFFLTGSNETADDIVHDAFVAIYRRYDGLEHAGSYLNQAVLNGCRDRAHRAVLHRRAIHRLGAELVTAQLEMLDDALAALPFNHRAAVVLRYYAQLPHDAIAGALGCPNGSVGPWIARDLVTRACACSLATTSRSSCSAPTSMRANQAPQICPRCRMISSIGGRSNAFSSAEPR